MLSHEHKCIFVHIPKAAGISIEQVFLDALGLDFAHRDSLLLGIANRDGKGPKILSHLTAREYVECGYVSQGTFDAYFKFTFVRNPYDRVYSFYKYFGFANLISFDRFVIDELPRLFSDPRFIYFVKPMVEYVCDDSGKTLVDFVGKVESIDRDFEVVAAKMKLGEAKPGDLNRTKDMSLGTHFLRTWRILRKHPGVLLRLSFRRKAAQKMFDEEMKQMVEKYYDADFSRFQYEK